MPSGPLCTSSFLVWTGSRHRELGIGGGESIFVLKDMKPESFPGGFQPMSPGHFPTMTSAGPTAQAPTFHQSQWLLVRHSTSGAVWAPWSTFALPLYRLIFVILPPAYLLMWWPRLPLESGGVQLPHEFLNPEQPMFADQLQMPQPGEKFSSGEMNSSASRGGPGCGWEEAVIAQGAGGGGARCTVGLAWLCWDTSHFCHFWPEGSPC